MTVTRWHEACELRFYTHTTTPWGPRTFKLDSRMRPNPIMRASFNKAKESGAFAGQLQFELLWPPNLSDGWDAAGWDEILRDNDWFELYALVDGRRDLITFGLLDTVTRSVTQVNGAMVSSWTVTARDFAKVIDETQIWFCEVGKNPNYIGEKILNMLNWAPGGSPDDLCRQIFRGFMHPPAGAGGAWECPPNFYAVAGYPVPMGDLINTDVWVNGLRGYTPIHNEALGTGYNLASILREWCNPAFNELFFDLRSSSVGSLWPAMVMRERPLPLTGPYGLSAWVAIPEVEIVRTQVLQESLTRSGVERYNAFVLSSTIDVLTVPEQMILYLPQLDEASMRIHGLRKFEQVTRFSSRLERDEINRWRTLLQQWYAPAPELLSGTISIRGFNPRLRVGRKVTLTYPAEMGQGPRFTAYLEGVGLNWSPGGGWRTSLTVSHGHYGGDTAYLAILATLAPDVAEAAPIVPKSDSLTCYNGPGTDLWWR